MAAVGVVAGASVVLHVSSLQHERQFVPCWHGVSLQLPAAVPDKHRNGSGEMGQVWTGF